MLGFLFAVAVVLAVLTAGALIVAVALAFGAAGVFALARARPAPHLPLRAPAG